MFTAPEAALRIRYPESEGSCAPQLPLGKPAEPQADEKFGAKGKGLSLSLGGGLFSDWVPSAPAGNSKLEISDG